MIYTLVIRVEKSLQINNVMVVKAFSVLEGKEKNNDKQLQNFHLEEDEKSSHIAKNYLFFQVGYLIVFIR